MQGPSILWPVVRRTSVHREASQSSTEVQDAGGLPLLEHEFMRDCKHLRKFSLPAELSVPHATAQTHWVGVCEGLCLLCLCMRRFGG